MFSKVYLPLSEEIFCLFFSQGSTIVQPCAILFIRFAEFKILLIILKLLKNNQKMTKYIIVKLFILSNLHRIQLYFVNIGFNHFNHFNHFNFTFSADVFQVCLQVFLVLQKKDQTVHQVFSLSSLRVPYHLFR